MTEAARRPFRRRLMKDMILDYIRKEYLDEEDAESMELDENTPLISSGIVDSFSMVSLKRFLERKCSISIPDDQATPEAFDTVSRIMELVLRFQKGA
jgi:acyl carrier protein